MDNLNDEEAALAWNSAWHPSFAGVAIVKRDGSFRRVNPQFWEMLGTTPDEFLGKRFQDITPIEMRQKDVQNSEYVAKGLIPFYVMPKKYSFTDGREVSVILMVTRAPRDTNLPFQFFVSRIMLDETGKMMEPNLDYLKEQQKQPLWTKSIVDFTIQYGKWLVGIGSVLCGILITLFGLNI